jgi:hypothetical protein
VESGDGAQYSHPTGPAPARASEKHAESHQRRYGDIVRSALIVNNDLWRRRGWVLLEGQRVSEVENTRTWDAWSAMHYDWENASVLHQIEGCKAGSSRGELSPR